MLKPTYQPYIYTHMPFSPVTNGVSIMAFLLNVTILTKTIILPLLPIGLSLLVACEDYQRVRQIESYAHLQAASSIIKELIIQEGSIEQGKAMEVIQGVNGGKDAWGNEILYKQRSSPYLSFILVSPGRDNALDIESIEDYFIYPEEDIRGHPDRDIVFRDAMPVTFSGK